ncbi:MAG: hypothetical protein NZM43_09425 [Saprospiraceae bacterium]|nr:hypothetical protein [Saprospiraceae bacterium]MDW8484535.1 hypothetical protein [Saprospiraceae bacterium]
MKGIVVFVIGLLSVQQLCLAQSKPAGRPAPQKQPTGWHVGLSFGLANNVVEMDFSDKPFWRYDFAEGWQYPGLEVHRALSSRLRATLGVNILQRGQQVKTIRQYAGVNDILLVRNYLNVPIGLSIALFDTRLSPYISAGIYGAFWMSGKWKGSMLLTMSNPYEEGYDRSKLPAIDFEAPYTFGQSESTGIRENRLDFGGWGGFGLQYKTKKGLLAFIGFNASRGLLPIYSDTKGVRGFEARYNLTYIIQIGATISINKNVTK